MNKKIIIITTKILLLVCMGTLSQNTYAGEASVSNNVSVESSQGTSKASIKTVVNGKVIEDRTFTSEDEPIVFTSTYRSDDAVTETSITTADPEIEALRARLTELLALLQYYVSLLEK